MSERETVWERIRRGLGQHGAYDGRQWARSQCVDYDDAEDFRWAPRLARKRLTALALERSLTEGITVAAALEDLIMGNAQHMAGISAQYPVPVMNWVGNCSELERTFIHAAALSCALNADRLLPTLPRPVSAGMNKARAVGKKPATGMIAAQWDLVAGPRASRTLVRIASGPLGSPIDLVVDAVAYGAACEEVAETLIEIAPDSGECRELTLDDATRDAGVAELLQRAFGVEGRTAQRRGGDWCVRCWKSDDCAEAARTFPELRSAPASGSS